MTEPALPPPSASPQPGPGRRWGVPFAVVGVVVLAFILAVEYLPKDTPGPAEPAPTPLFVQGTLSLEGRNSFFELDGNCIGDNGYDDIQAGTAVTIYDGAKVLATSSLRLGKVRGTALAPTCEFPFALDVPPSADFYSIEISHRGRVHYPAERLSQPLVITLGY